MKTIFGVEWPLASYPEVTFILVIFILIGILVLGIKYYQNLKKQEEEHKEFFQFKLKRHGFTASQLRIIDKMLALLNLEDPLKFTKDPEHFDTALARYLSSLASQNLKAEPMMNQCNDILEIWDKLFFPEEYKRPIASITEIENGQLIYFVIGGRDFYFGRTVGVNATALTLKLFRSEQELKNLKPGTGINVYFTRIGDGEYSFTSIVTDIVNSIMAVKIPETFSKDKEYRHPYIDILLSCELAEADPKGGIEPEPVNGTIMKLNEYEIIIRMGSKLNYQKAYILTFELMDYKFRISANILANSMREEANVFYYTFKITDISQVALKVLKKFVVDRL